MPRSRVGRLAVPGCVLFLAALQFELLPQLRYAWAFNLWQYLPTLERGLLCAAVAAVCIPSVRDALAAGARRLDRWLRQPGDLAIAWAAIPLVTGLLWLVRERVLQGDSIIFLGVAHLGWNFVFPDIGATFVLGLVFRSALAVSASPTVAVQLSICLCGGLTTFFLLRAARALGPVGRSPFFLLLFITSGAMTRIFAGHVEAYAYLLPPVAAYLWLALETLRGRPRWIAACVALGIAVWMHLASLFLLPSLLLLAVLTDEGRDLRRGLARGVRGVAVASIPSLGFLASLWALGYEEDLNRAMLLAEQILGAANTHDAVRWWVRGWGGRPSIGTDYVFLSAGHLKYLLNAFYMLVPATLPLLAFFALRAPRRLLGSPTARFLCAAIVPLSLYAVVLRPFWGPYDWDLFAITALFMGTLAAHLVATELPEARFHSLATTVICFQLLFVGLPFLQIGTAVYPAAGPFTPGGFSMKLKPANTPPPDWIAPWL